MGKPKYYENQILINRTTNKIHYMRFVGMIHYAVPPIELFGKDYVSANQALDNWILSKKELQRKFKILPKREAKLILQTMELLYEQA